MEDFVTYSLSIPSITEECWNTFLNSLKINFPKFAMYQDGQFYFLPGEDETAIQQWIDSFSCNQGELDVYDISNNMDVTTVVRTTDPTIYENLDKDVIWINKTTGEIFVCLDDETDANIWRGTSPGKIIRPVPTADIFDFFGDNSALAFYQLNGNANDVGGKYNGRGYSVSWVDGLDGQAVHYNKDGTVQIFNLPFERTTPAVTISAWVNWNGNSVVMPFGFKKYDIYINSGYLGFNTAAGDIYGFDFSSYSKKWVYLTVVFRYGEPGEIYLNGVKQQLSQITSASFYAPNAVFQTTFCIFGWTYNSGYRRFGTIERLRIFNRALTEEEASNIFSAEMEYILKIGGSI